MKKLLYVPAKYLPAINAAVAAERERCARIAEEFSSYTGRGTENNNDLIGIFARGNRSAANSIAAAIRNGDAEKAVSTYCPFCGGLGADHHVNCGLHTTNVEQVAESKDV